MSSRTKRVWLIAGAVVVLLVALNFLAQALDRAAGGGAPSGANDSSYATTDQGLAAYAALLAHFDHTVTRQRGSFADDAERNDDLERAVRLRFKAGLLRLGTHGAITYRPSVTTGEVRASLDSATFEELAGTFERVAYGGREAGQPDVDAARREWPQVLHEASVREPGIPARSEAWPERPVAEGDKSGKQEADRR